MYKPLQFFLGFLFLTTVMAAQDECSNAQLLTFTGSSCNNAYHFRVDMTGSTASSGTTPLPACGDYQTGRPDAWVRFVVPAGVTTMNLNGGTESSCGFFCAPRPNMQVFRGSCAALTEMACYETPGLQAQGFSNETINVTPGETIFLRLWERTGSIIQYDIVISLGTAAPANDACTNATPLGTVGCNVNANAGGVQAPESCSGASGEGATWNTIDNVVFYTFVVTPTTSQPVQITLNNVRCAGGCNEIQLALYSGGCAGVGGSDGSTPANTSTYHGCNAGTGTVTVTSTTNLAPGTYYLMVDGCSAGLPVQTSSCLFGISSDVITVPLPLTITQFEANAGSDAVQLNWNVEELENTSYFQLERSSNGVDFISIGEVNAQEKQLAYAYVDQDLSQAYLGHYYYRLRQVDYNGEEYLSDVLVVKIDNHPKTLTIFPNPSEEGQSINIRSDFDKQESIQLRLYNSLGELVLLKEYLPQAGGLSIELPTQQLAAGVYSLSLGEGANRIIRKVVIR